MSFCVLIVDDEEQMLRGLAAFLEDDGFAVLTASSGEEGMVLIEDHQVHACIVDMRLPGMVGSEFIERVHRDQPQLRFLIHTGSSDFTIPPRLRALGIRDAHLFIKPLVDLSLLSRALRELLGFESRSER
jgi:YesN/AraC family two-component response regulator